MRNLLVAVVCLLLVSCSGQEERREILIENAAGESIYLQIEKPLYAAGKMAIIQHGLASNMGHPVVQTVKQAFRDKGYWVITFDSRNSLGKSSGDTENVRLETFEEDLQAVIDWAARQDFYKEPFALAGHSLGGASVLQYAAENPLKVEIAVPVAPVVSGQKWEDACMLYMSDFCRNWKGQGSYRYQNSVIPYQVLEEAKSYDAFQLAERIHAAVLLVTPEDDHIIPCRDIKALYAVLHEPKYLAVIPRGGHNFETEQSRKDLYNSVVKFLSDKTAAAKSR